MYKPTKRARVASPHFPSDWNRRSIKTYFFNKVIAFGTFVVEKGYTLDSSSFHFAI